MGKLTKRGGVGKEPMLQFLYEDPAAPPKILTVLVLVVVPALLIFLVESHPGLFKKTTL